VKLGNPGWPGFQDSETRTQCVFGCCMLCGLTLAQMDYLKCSLHFWQTSAVRGTSRLHESRKNWVGTEYAIESFAKKYFVVQVDSTSPERTELATEYVVASFAKKVFSRYK